MTNRIIPEALYQQVVEALEDVDGLIEHQFSGTREGMSALQNACDDALAALTALSTAMQAQPVTDNNYLTNAYMAGVERGKEIARAQPAEPVMYQERTDLRGPYSSFQGWTDWRECSKEQYEMIKEYPTFYYTAQSRALVVADENTIAQPATPEAALQKLVSLSEDLSLYDEDFGTATPERTMPEFEVVAYGYENYPIPGRKPPLAMVKVDCVGDQYPDFATKLVRLSDVAAAWPVERKPLTEQQITSIAYDCNALPEIVTDKTLVVFVRAIENHYGIPAPSCSARKVSRNICDECETVSHCSKNGCVPKQRE